MCLQSSTINGSLFWGRWNQRYRQLRLSGIITHTHTHTHTLKLQFLCVLFSNRVEKIIQICQQQLHSWEYTPGRSSCTCVSEDRYKDVHTLIVCTSRKQEIIQMFTDSKQESTLLYIAFCGIEWGISYKSENDLELHRAKLILKYNYEYKK